jgi:hypothetical protein
MSSNPNFDLQQGELAMLQTLQMNLEKLNVDLYVE